MLYAVDGAWWKHYLSEAQAGFAGELVSHSRFVGTRFTRSHCVRNSGANAIALAAARGASRIVLLGYDLQFTGERKHWHGDHPATLKNAGSIGTWPEKFQQMAAQLPPDVSVINCSRATALMSFPRGTLESELQ